MIPFGQHPFDRMMVPYSDMAHHLPAGPVLLRARFSYTAHTRQEVSFRAGEMAQVAGPSPHPAWYFVVNPSTGWSGLAPAYIFDAPPPPPRYGGAPMGAYYPAPPHPPYGGHLHHTRSTPALGPKKSKIMRPPLPPPKTYTFLGSALYNYTPQDKVSEQLELQRGSRVKIYAHVSRDWLVATRILDEQNQESPPGLVPTKYIALLDPLTLKLLDNKPEDLLALGAIATIQAWHARLRAQNPTQFLPLAQYGGAPTSPASSSYSLPGCDPRLYGANSASRYPPPDQSSTFAPGTPASNRPWPMQNFVDGCAACGAPRLRSSSANSRLPFGVGPRTTLHYKSESASGYFPMGLQGHQKFAGSQGRIFRHLRSSSSAQRGSSHAGLHSPLTLSRKPSSLPSSLTTDTRSSRISGMQTAPLRPQQSAPRKLNSPTPPLGQKPLLFRKIDDHPPPGVYQYSSPQNNHPSSSGNGQVYRSQLMPQDETSSSPFLASTFSATPAQPIPARAYEDKSSKLSNPTPQTRRGSVHLEGTQTASQEVSGTAHQIGTGTVQGGNDPKHAVKSNGGGLLHDSASVVEAGTPYVDSIMCTHEEAHSIGYPSSPSPDLQALPPGKLTSASVDSMHEVSSAYRYCLRAVWMNSLTPDGDLMSKEVCSYERRQLKLYRAFQDFTELHNALQSTFPPGTQEKAQLPLLPLSLPEKPESKAIQACLCIMNNYVHSLVQLSPALIQTAFFRSFFNPRPGDQCVVLSEVEDENPIIKERHKSEERKQDGPGEEKITSGVSGIVRMREDKEASPTPSTTYQSASASVASSLLEIEQGKEDCFSMVLPKAPETAESDRHAAPSHQSKEECLSMFFSKASGTAESNCHPAPNSHMESRQSTVSALSGHTFSLESSIPSVLAEVLASLDKMQLRGQTEIQGSAPRPEKNNGQPPVSPLHPDERARPASSSKSPSMAKKSKPPEEKKRQEWAFLAPDSSSSAESTSHRNKPCGWTIVPVYHPSTDELISVRFDRETITYADLLQQVRIRLDANVGALRYREKMTECDESPPAAAAETSQRIVSVSPATPPSEARTVMTRLSNDEDVLLWLSKHSLDQPMLLFAAEK